MERSDIVYQTYLKILRRELISAMGCTEPVALAYCPCPNESRWKPAETLSKM